MSSISIDRIGKNIWPDPADGFLESHVLEVVEGIW